jgi:signal transduction histidine kinase
VRKKRPRATLAPETFPAQDPSAVPVAQGRARRVRSRLVVGVGVVGLIVVGAGLPGVLAVSAELHESQSLVTLAQLNRQAVTLAHSLADERDEVTAYIAAGRDEQRGPESSRRALSEAHSDRVDRQIDEIGGSVPGDRADLRRDLAAVPSVRRTALTGDGTAMEAHRAYTTVITTLHGLADELTEKTPPRAADTSRAPAELGFAVEQASATRGLLIAALSVPAEKPKEEYDPVLGRTVEVPTESGKAAEEARDSLSAAAQQSRVRELAALSDFDQAAGAEARDSLAATVTGADVKAAETQLARLTDQPRLTSAERKADRKQIEAALTARIEQMRGVESALAEDRITALEDLRDGDVTALQVRIAVLGALVLLTIAVLSALLRTITRPLAVLRIGAARLAAAPDTEEPVGFTGRNDEFAQVVRSLNTLHAKVRDLSARATQLAAQRGATSTGRHAAPGADTPRLAEAARARAELTAELAAERADNRARLDALGAERAETHRHLKELTAERAETHRRLDELVVERAETHRRLDELLAERGETHRRLDELSAERSDIHRRVEELTAERAETHHHLDELRNERVELQSERAEAGRQAQRLATEVERLRHSIDHTFVNLSLRTLGLVERQLGIIEKLEEREQDPERLATLFKLDHMATVMRRHSENLLVLAGTEHQHGHPGDVPLVDVLRAAVSEIERYERVVIQSLPPHVQVAGFAADDLSHLVAELLENATAFSPPENSVELSGWLLESGEVMLSVTDTGIGMAAGRLAELNEGLEHPASFEERAGRGTSGLGLRVTALLAARHGVRVQLRDQAQGQGGGVTAVVVVPRPLLPQEQSEPRRRQAGARDTQAVQMPGSVAEANSNALPSHPRHRAPLSLTAGTDPLVAAAEAAVRAAGPAAHDRTAEHDRPAEHGRTGEHDRPEGAETGQRPPAAAADTREAENGHGTAAGGVTERTFEMRLPGQETAPERETAAPGREPSAATTRGYGPMHGADGEPVRHDGRREAAAPPAGQHGAATRPHGAAAVPAPGHAPDATGAPGSAVPGASGPGAAAGTTAPHGAAAPAAGPAAPVWDRVTDKGLPKRTPRIVKPPTGPGERTAGTVDAAALRRKLGGFQKAAEDGRREARAEIERTGEAKPPQESGDTVEEARS